MFKHKDFPYNYKVKCHRKKDVQIYYPKSQTSQHFSSKHSLTAEALLVCWTLVYQDLLFD